jgi:hypothetical protein
MLYEKKDIRNNKTKKKKKRKKKKKKDNGRLPRKSVGLACMLNNLRVK